MALSSQYQSYEKYLIDRGYSTSFIKCCKGGVAHLSLWMGETHKVAIEVGETLIAEFLDIHLPRCSCGTVIHDRSSLRTSLVHLLAALRGTGAIPPRVVHLTRTATLGVALAEQHKKGEGA